MYKKILTNYETWFINYSYLTNILNWASTCSFNSSLMLNVVNSNICLTFQNCLWTMPCCTRVQFDIHILTSTWAYATNSIIKWWWISMHVTKMVVATLFSCFKSTNTQCLKQVSWHVVEVVAMYSTSIVDKDFVDCFFEDC